MGRRQDIQLADKYRPIAARGLNWIVSILLCISLRYQHLEGLKNSMFENLEFLVPEGASTMTRLVNNANKVFTNAKQFTDVVSAAPVIGSAVSKLQPVRSKN